MIPFTGSSRLSKWLKSTVKENTRRRECRLEINRGKPGSLAFHLPSNIKPVQLLCLLLLTLWQTACPKMSHLGTVQEQRNYHRNVPKAQHTCLLTSSLTSSLLKAHLCTGLKQHSLRSETNMFFNSTHNVIWSGIWAIWRLPFQNHANLFEQWQVRIRKQLSCGTSHSVRQKPDVVASATPST